VKRDAIETTPMTEIVVGIPEAGHFVRSINNACRRLKDDGYRPVRVEVDFACYYLLMASEHLYRTGLTEANQPRYRGMAVEIHTDMEGARVVGGGFDDRYVSVVVKRSEGA
jgi:hypothetical protein